MSTVKNKEIPASSFREGTPGLSDKLFVNSAGSSLMPRAVLLQMQEYLLAEAYLGGYGAAEQYQEPIADFYVQASRLLNCEPANIAFACNATDAYAKVLDALDFVPGDTILTSDNEYIANQLAFISLRKRFGLKIITIKSSAQGLLNLEDLERQMKKYKPVLVALTHIAATSGTVQDALGVGALCRKYGSWYLLDACQSIGQLVVDVKKIGCDFLTATGRKFLRGPRGTGFLYVSDRVLDSELCPVVLHLHGANWIDEGTPNYQLQRNAKRFEFWECSYAGMLGLKAALEYANNIGMEYIENHNRALVQEFRGALMQVPGLNILDRGKVLSSIVTVHDERSSLAELESYLTSHHVVYSVSHKQSSRTDFERKGIDWAIRFSPHYFNTTQELEQIVALLYERGAGRSSS